MRIAIRVDAALHIGTGHVMRCLSIAHILKNIGASVCFICRKQEGNLQETILAEGFELRLLPEFSTPLFKTPVQTSPSHGSWLGCSWQQDLLDTKLLVQNKHFEWLIVDHYALDHNWEVGIRSLTNKLMVIDDLADRRHECDLLLDQTYGRHADDYTELTNRNCIILAGSDFALLRPEFARLRQSSLNKREAPVLNNILITMGGVDKDNYSCKVLQALKTCRLPKTTQINVVLGPSSPSIGETIELAASMPWKTNVIVNSKNMAVLMLEADLAIGAAGATSWERCCLGLPSLILILADNQKEIAHRLAKANAAIALNSTDDIKKYVDILTESSQILKSISTAASKVADGLGCKRAVEKMLQ